MKFFMLLLSLALFANAAGEKLIIDASNFETDDSTGVTTFTGNVKLTMDKDKLNSQQLQIFMKPNSKAQGVEPIKYVATGSSSFEIHSNGKIYKGKGNKIIYSPQKQEYTIIGNGYVKEEIEKRELFGEIIYINQLTGNAKVNGSEKKPVRFIINVDNKKSE